MDLLKLLALDRRREISLIMLLSLGSAILSIAVIVYIKARLLGADGALNFVLLQFGLLLLLLLVMTVLAQSSLHYIGHRFVMGRRSWLVKRVMNTEIEQLEKIGGSAVMAALNTDIRNLSMAFVSLPELMYGGVLCVLAMVYMAWLSVSLFVITLIVLGVTGVLGMLVGGRIRHYIVQLRDSDDALYRDYQAIIDGRKELAMNRARANLFYSEEFIRDADNYRQNITRADVHYGFVSNLSNVVMLGLVGLDFYLAVGLGWASAETAATYALLLLFLRTPLMNGLGAIPTLLTANVSLKKLESLQLGLDSGDLIPSPSLADFNTLEFKKISYTYQDAADSKPFQVGPINFSIKRGELIFIIGGNGSGKSTFARLLTGLYIPQSGEIFVDDKAVNLSELANYRALFAGVFTDFYLFRRLISGDGEEIGAELIDEWLGRLGMEHKLSHAEGWLNDTRFSQGQRKRLALMVALLEERNCILLDEWAADQDPQFRRIFYRELLPQLRDEGKTIIAITHDDHYFDVADRVMRMDAGQLHELTGEGLEHARRVVSDMIEKK